MKLLLATGNAHKVGEIKAIFKVDGLQFVTANELPGLPDVVEDRDSFRGNAVKKAETLARVSGLPALADDSGLEVDALDGAPGVYSARYAGVHGDDRANNARLLDRLRGSDDRAARFRCVIALAEPNGEVKTVEGVCEGRIARAVAGDSGFGYDPVFIPEGHDKTFAQLGPDIKNRISHRAQALRRAYECWIEK